MKGGMVLRLMPEDSVEQAQMVALAASTCGTPLTISIDIDDKRGSELSALGCPVCKQSLPEFLKSMLNFERVRTCSPNIPREMYEFAAQHDKFICTDVPVKNGRIELIHYIKEQSVSFEYHRYGSFSEVPPVE